MHTKWSVWKGDDARIRYSWFELQNKATESHCTRRQSKWKIIESTVFFNFQSPSSHCIASHCIRPVCTAVMNLLRKRCLPDWLFAYWNSIGDLFSVFFFPLLSFAQTHRVTRVHSTRWKRCVYFMSSHHKIHGIWDTCDINKKKQRAEKKHGRTSERNKQENETKAKEFQTFFCRRIDAAKILARCARVIVSCHHQDEWL